jgi:hypothetical protein
LLRQIKLLFFLAVVFVLQYGFDASRHHGAHERADAASPGAAALREEHPEWLAETGGIAAILGLRHRPGVLFTEAYDGHLLGSKTLGQEVTYLEGLVQQGAAYLVQNDGWTGQPWASSLPSSP